MSLAIVPYEAAHEDAVRAFNARLQAGGLDPNVFSLRFPESHVPQWLPRREGAELYQDYFVALDATAAARGAYILKHQPFLVLGRPLELVTYQLPIAEGIVDRRYAMVGVQLYRDALSRSPLLWGLGGGAPEGPIGKFLQVAGWRTARVPFFFRIVHPGTFLANVTAFKTTSLRRFGLEALRLSGLGGLGLRAAQALRTRHRRAAAVSWEVVSEFADWADELWLRCRGAHTLIAARDAASLRILYPAGHPRFIRLKVSRGPRILGWAVLLNTPMRGHKQFGDMRVGTLVDCLAEPEDACEVVACAQEVLEGGGADVLITNQASLAWGRALGRCGFLEGPSNFPLFLSPQVTGLLAPFEANAPHFHLNRGDGDGPINL